MALAFPNSPLVGDQYTSGGVTWQWNGTTWDIVISGGGGGGGGSSLSFATIAVSGQDSVSADSGADWYGMIFFKSSPRNISIQKAKTLITSTPESLTPIAVLVDPSIDFIKKCLNNE